ncbi:MAG TPA: SDR family oxidoreductase [Chloroflexota bacterium]
MSKSHVVAITGATGEIGRRVARNLAERGIAQRLIVRDQERAPHLPNSEIAVASSYSDKTSMRRALTGTHTLFLVSGRESADRVQHHVDAIDTAVAAGVQRIVYLSFIGAASNATFTLARQHYLTEQHIRSSGVRFTFLRPALYLDSIPRYVGEDGALRGPADGGSGAFIARDDIAGVASVVLPSEDHDGETYNLTGREELTLTQCAEQLSRVVGRTIIFQDETLEEAWRSRSGYGAPHFEKEGWITSYLAIAAGEMGPASDIVYRLTGQDALTLEEYLRLYPDSYRRLLPQG